MRDFQTSGSWLAVNLPSGVWVVFRIVGILLAAGLVADGVLLFRALRRKPDWAGALRRLQDQRWTCREAGIVLATFSLVVLASWIVAHAFRCVGLHPDDRPVPGLVISQILAIQVIPVTVVISLIRRRPSAAPAFGWGERKRMVPDLVRAAVFYLATWPPMVVMALLYLLVLVAAGYPIHRQEVVRWLTNPELPLAFRVTLGGLAIGLAPLCEEIVFRGVLLSAAAKIFGPVGAVLSTALLFALAHFQVTQFVPLVMMAVAFALGYLRTGNLAVPVAMHAAFNATTVACAYLARHWPMGG